MKFNEPGREIAMKSNQSIGSLRARTWKGAIDVLSFRHGDERRGGKPSVSMHASPLTPVDNSLFLLRSVASLIQKNKRQSSER